MKRLVLAALPLWLSGQAAAVTYQDVAPIFENNCIMCHQGDAAPLSLQLDSLAHILKGSENGPEVIAGKPDASELIKRIRGESEPRMPLTGPPYLSDADIKLIEDWVAGGLQAGDAASTIEPEPKPAKKPIPDEVLWSDVLPLLGQRCAKCHTENGLMGPAPEHFNVTSYARIMRTDERARIIPGRPEYSEIVRRVRGHSLPRMPLDGPPYLNEIGITLIQKWIAQGARDENGQAAPIPVGAKVRLGGTLTGYWELDGAPIVVDSGTRIKKQPGIGQHVRVRGVVLPDGRIRATRIHRK